MNVENNTKKSHQSIKKKKNTENWENSCFEKLVRFFLFYKYEIQSIKWSLIAITLILMDYDSSSFMFSHFLSTSFCQPITLISHSFTNKNLTTNSKQSFWCWCCFFISWCDVIVVVVFVMERQKIYIYFFLCFCYKRDEIASFLFFISGQNCANEGWRRRKTERNNRLIIGRKIIIWPLKAKYSLSLSLSHFHLFNSSSTIHPHHPISSTT
jgi:hypothetical protein